MTVTCLLTTLTLAEDLPLQLSLKPKVFNLLHHFFRTVARDSWNKATKAKYTKQSHGRSQQSVHHAARKQILCKKWSGL